MTHSACTLSNSAWEPYTMYTCEQTVRLCALMRQLDPSECFGTVRVSCRPQQGPYMLQAEAEHAVLVGIARNKHQSPCQGLTVQTNRAFWWHTVEHNLRSLGNVILVTQLCLLCCHNCITWLLSILARDPYHTQRMQRCSVCHS